MGHREHLADYLALNSIAKGDPNDVGETLEGVAARMLATPSAKQASKELRELIRMFAERGDSEGATLQDNAAARVIFDKYGLAE